MDKAVKIAEIDKKIKQLELKTRIEEDINNKFQYDFEYTSKFQLNSTSIRAFQETNNIIKPYLDKKLDYIMFEYYSKLNFGVYPKLISIMLNPEKFCNIWYSNISISKDLMLPFIIINKLLDTFFVMCYKPIEPIEPIGPIGEFVSPFNDKNKKNIDRDTQIFKSIYIQNLLILSDKLISENSDTLDEILLYIDTNIFKV
jgi:hypothetical protein